MHYVNEISIAQFQDNAIYRIKKWKEETSMVVSTQVEILPCHF